MAFETPLSAGILETSTVDEPGTHGADTAGGKNRMTDIADAEQLLRLIHVAWF
jgi:hypothetical protein